MKTKKKKNDVERIALLNIVIQRHDRGGILYLFYYLSKLDIFKIKKTINLNKKYEGET